ncbi:MAG: hypothetical protein JWR83_470 [Aeromicrobium sp.]|nr:hypothetical protein [Aeromicrobium sp.]
MKNLLLVYRAMAWTVGTLIIVLFAAWAVKSWTTEGTDIQKAGDDITAVVGVTHGFLYMGYLVIVAVLARATRWSIPFTIVTLLVGLIPFATFWAERRATQLVRAKFPETADATPQPS